MQIEGSVHPESQGQEMAFSPVMHLCPLHNLCDWWTDSTSIPKGQSGNQTDCCDTPVAVTETSSSLWPLRYHLSGCHYTLTFLILLEVTSNNPSGPLQKVITAPHNCNLVNLQCANVSPSFSSKSIENTLLPKGPGPAFCLSWWSTVLYPAPGHDRTPPANISTNNIRCWAYKAAVPHNTSKQSLFRHAD